MSFLALRDLAVCMKTKTCFFFNVLTKIGYFNTECCIFSNIKILLDINQNDIKNTRENCKIPKNIFEFFLKKKTGWTWPNHSGLGLTRPIYCGLDSAQPRGLG